MLKKLTLLGMAIAAMAVLAVPASASATQLKESGKAVAVGQRIRMTEDFSSPITLESSTLGTFKCTFFEIETELLKNSGGAVELGVLSGGAPFCTLNGKSGSAITTVRGSFVSSKTGKGEAALEIVMTIPLLGICTYSTGLPEAFSFTSGSSTISFPKLAPAELWGFPLACGEAILYGGLTLETTSGTAVELV